MLSCIKAQSLFVGYLMLVLGLASVTGCATSNNNKSTEKPIEPRHAHDFRTGLTSKNHYLTLGDLEKFRPGRSKDEVLEDIQWRGNFVIAARIKEQSISLISYQVTSEVPPANGDAIDGLYGKWVMILAVFVGEKFTKFIESPPEEMEKISFCGERCTHPAPVKVGDVSWLARAMNARPVSIDELKVQARPANATTAPSSEIDWGLTTVCLFFAPAISLKRSVELRENIALRDQFNAARLRIGMTKKEVELILAANPLESGNVEAGDYKIYGARKRSFDVNLLLNFSDILIVFREDRAIRIISVPATIHWREQLAIRFTDLPQTAESVDRPPPFIGRTLAEIAEMRDPAAPWNETGLYFVSDKGARTYQIWKVIYGGRPFLVQVHSLTGKVSSYRAWNS